jgi:peptidoglycan biosynthesis protein MviN/MurJ (putative lipid II flippase)
VFGITLSMAIANTASFLVMYAILHRRLGGLPVMPIVTVTLVSGAVAALCVGLGWLGWEAVIHALGESLGGQVAAMVVAIVLTWGAYAVLALRLRLVNVPQLRRALRRG